MSSYWPTGDQQPGATPAEIEFARNWRDTPKVVFSNTLEQVEGNWTITTVNLRLTARVPGIDQAKFDQIAADAKANCPVSRVLNAKISLDATLETA